VGDDLPFSEFVQRIRAGDAAAAEELVRRYESAVRVAVRIRLTDPNLKRLFDSVDVCQSVLASFFLRAAAGEYDLTDPGQLVRLLVKMAQNKLATQARFHRRQRRHQGRTTGLVEQGEQAATDAGPERIAVGRDLLQAVRARLTPEERAVADRRGAGQAWEAIAAELGGTGEQRRKQLKRALDRVSAELGLELEEGELPN
jgi:RNA polymerase sigma-70 factor (ECF subfamily)